MKFVTVATSENAGLRLLLKSCEHFSIDMEILGFGKPYFGNGSKIELVTKFLRKLPGDEIVLFTDAYDSFFVREISDLEQDFLRRNQTVLFSAEDNYYFRVQSFRNFFLHPYYRIKYPKSESDYPDYRYLNSGGYMGFATEILEVLEGAGIKANMHSDQANLHRYFVDNPGKIQLDYNHDIFTNYGKFAEPVRFSIANDVLTNRLTNSNPYVFHFPGLARRGLNEFSQKFSFLR